MKRARGLLAVLLLTGATVGVGVWMGFHPSVSHAAANGVVLTGIVKSDSGQAMDGVAVTAKNADQKFTTTVFTDEQGNYYFPPLATGKYEVWAQAAGYGTGRGSLDVSNQLQHQDFTLNKMTGDFVRQMTGDEIINSLPEDTPMHRKMKAIVKNNCQACHPADYILQNRFDEHGWMAILNAMSRVSGGGSGFFPVDQAPWPVINYYKSELAPYLAEMRGPGTSPMQIKLRPRPTGDAARVVITDYELPLYKDGSSPTNDGSDWSMGPGSYLNGVRGTHDAQMDMDGNIWLTNTAMTPDRTIVRLNVKTGEVTNFKVPAPNGMAAGSHGMIMDQKGDLWFNVMYGGGEDSGTGSLGRIDPRTGKIDVFQPPKGMAGVGGSLDVDLNGNIWGTTNRGAIRFDAKTQTFTEFKSVTPKDEKGDGETYGVAVDKDGNGWWTEISIDLVGKGLVSTGESEEVAFPPHTSTADGTLSPDEKKMFDLAGVDAPANGGLWTQAPRRMGADKHSDYVWICDFWGDNLAKVDIHTLKPTFYPAPPDSGPYDAVIDKDHMVWVNFMNADRIGKFNPQTQQWTEYNLPVVGADTRHLSIMDQNGPTQVIVNYPRNSQVGRLQFRTQADLQALKAQVQGLSARNQ